MLPKGVIEEGETAETVALREVREETGISNVRVVADLGEERYYFFWRSEDTYYDKTVRYFLLSSSAAGRRARRPKKHSWSVRGSPSRMPSGESSTKRRARWCAGPRNGWCNPNWQHHRRVPRG